MSALTSHIKVLRAEAEALAQQNDEFAGSTDQQVVAKFVLLAMSTAKLKAADQLEAAERELESQVLI